MSSVLLLKFCLFSRGERVLVKPRINVLQQRCNSVRIAYVMLVEDDCVKHRLLRQMLLDLLSVSAKHE